jgi:hypothetical protein
MTGELLDLASTYIQNMTSIRGRRIRKLIAREFGTCTMVKMTEQGDGPHEFAGELENGGSIKMRTNGKGKYVEVFLLGKNGDTIEIRKYDLLKDSLPLII